MKTISSIMFNCIREMTYTVKQIEEELIRQKQCESIPTFNDNAFFFSRHLAKLHSLIKGQSEQDNDVRLAINGIFFLIGHGFMPKTDSAWNLLQSHLSVIKSYIGNLLFHLMMEDELELMDKVSATKDTMKGQ